MGSGIKVPVFVRPQQHTIYYEYLDLLDGNSLTFVHCDVVCRWTRQAKKRLHLDFNSLLALRTQPVYCLRHTKMQEKFIRMFGFTYAFTAADGEADIYKLEI
jgi:hypothetical protein